MKMRRGRNLSARATRTFLRQVSHHLDPELSKELRCTVYVLDDGGAVLVYEGGTAAHWFSCEELVTRHRAAVERALARKDPLLDVLPQAERFRNDIQDMIAELPTLLGIDAALLDFSDESLNIIDDAIRRLGSERILTPEIFPSLTAYVGEVIRRQVNGSWEVRTTRGGTCHEPDIVDPTGGRYGLLRIYKQLLEYGRAASMRTFVHAALTTHRLLPRH